MTTDAAPMPPRPVPVGFMPPPPKPISNDLPPMPVSPGMGHNGDPLLADQRELTEPQYLFVTSPAKFPAMVAGYGAGKTEGGILRALRLKFEYPKQTVGYYMPTYDLIAQIAYPRFQEILTASGYYFALNESKKELHIFGAGKIIFRTMDQPERIVGYEHADAVIDELDTLKTDKAAEAWRKILARNRQKKPDGSPNTIAVATTPEGFRFVYEKWKRTPIKGSQIIKASTASNAKNLPDDYIETLKDNYPANMLLAYLEGEFVNLTHGCVYPEFDRAKNNCKTTIKKGESLHVGIDFNVGAMAAVVHVMRDGEPHAVGEFVGYLDTPALIAALKSRYQSGEDKHRIIAYPDASGKSRKTVNASQSDIALLKQAGFMVLAKSTNPFVKDRVASFNKLIHKDGKRVYKVNVDACPHLVEGLEKQAYDKNGEPDKTSGFDHVMDAAGYFVNYRFPIMFGKARKTNLKGT